MIKIKQLTEQWFCHCPTTTISQSSQSETHLPSVSSLTLSDSDTVEPSKGKENTKASINKGREKKIFSLLYLDAYANLFKAKFSLGQSHHRQQCSVLTEPSPITAK